MRSPIQLHALQAKDSTFFAIRGWREEERNYYALTFVMPVGAWVAVLAVALWLVFR
jgi:hypothetical protein